MLLIKKKPYSIYAITGIVAVTNELEEAVDQFEKDMDKIGKEYDENMKQLEKDLEDAFDFNY